MQTYRRFSQMPVSKEAMDVSVAIFNFSQSLPRVEDYALTSQIRRSSNSVPANIAEAFGRYHHGNKLNFYYNARGSLCETKSHLHYAAEIGYLSPSSKQQLDAQLDNVWRQMNQIIKRIRQTR